MPGKQILGLLLLSLSCQAFLYKPHPTMCTGNTFVKTKTCHMKKVIFLIIVEPL